MEWASTAAGHGTTRLAAGVAVLLSLSCVAASGATAQAAPARRPPPAAEGIWVREPADWDWRCETIQALGPALAAASDIQLRALLAAVAILVPHPGLQVRGGDGVRFGLSWPWSWPFGPASEREVTPVMCASDHVEEYKPNRLVLEPGFVLASPTVFFVRPGYRFLWHRLGWPLGIGAGLGSTLEVQAGEVRASVSPEALVQLGECCRPSYLMFSIRYDRFFAGEQRDVFTAHVGLTYF
jgi:hypothetical protein